MSVRPPGVSPGIAPPPGLSVGIPLPAFAPQQRQAPRAEPKQSAAQQTIKVEIGEVPLAYRRSRRGPLWFFAFLLFLIAVAVIVALLRR